MPTLDSKKKEALLFAQFLTRVHHGKDLDVQFEEDENITPLEAAGIMLNQFKEEDENLRNLQEEIKTFVKVQSVAVCMEKGKFKMASEVLDRLFDDSESNKYLRTKLEMVIVRKDPYHEFLEHFTYIKMLKKINSYIDILLSKRPPAFLLQAAKQVVEAKARSQQKAEVEDILEHNVETSESNEPETESDTEDPMQSIERRKEKLQRRLFVGTSTPWHPDKPAFSSRILNNSNPEKKSTNVQEKAQPGQHAQCPESGASRKRQRWSAEEDNLLKKGVTKYGVGNWCKILQSYDFNNRTGVMLKDRWRTLKKLDIVGLQLSKIQ
ncbi:telomeric repeat-binding factor 1 isoform X2 [Hyperolius riggenbachi]